MALKYTTKTKDTECVFLVSRLDYPKNIKHLILTITDIFVFFTINKEVLDWDKSLFEKPPLSNRDKS